MIAVGIGGYDPSELKLIATDKKRHVFTAKDFDKLLELVTSLRRKACYGEFTGIFWKGRLTDAVDRGVASLISIAGFFFLGGGGWGAGG